MRFADQTLVAQAINGDPCEIEFAYVLPSGESFTFTVHAVYFGLTAADRHIDYERPLLP